MSADRGMIRFRRSQEFGRQILDAIGELTRVVREQPRQIREELLSNTHAANLQAIDAKPGSTVNVNPDSTPTAIGDDGQFSGLPVVHHQSTYSEGLDTILGWAVFPPNLGPIRNDDAKLVPMSDELPPMSPPDLRRFQAKYRRIVHVVNPLLDLSILDRYVTSVIENGLDWSTRTCLVALVFAIGAICDEPLLDDPNTEVSSSAQQSELKLQRKLDSEIAYRWWSIACKRLGMAMSLSNLESAQCLCLSG